MSAPTVIKSTDSGAAVLSGVAGQAIVFFDYVLVTRLGWTKAFSGTNKAVYRPSSGRRLFYRVDDTGSPSVNKFGISTYESMSNVNTGAGASGVMYAYKSGSVDTTARQYIVVGDSAGFHLLVKPLYWDWDRWEWNYYGDFIPFFSSDAFNSVITGIAPNTSNWNEVPRIYDIATAIPSISYTDFQCRLSRRLSGDVSTRGAGALLRNGGGLHTNQTMGTIGAAYPVDGKLLYTKPYLCDGQERTFRGCIPGLYCPEHGSGLTHGVIYPDGTKSLMAITQVNDCSTQGVLLIDVGEGFRP